MPVVRMDVSAAHELASTLQHASRRCETTRRLVAAEELEAQVLLGRFRPSVAPARLFAVTDRLRTDARDLRWRVDHLTEHGVPFPASRLTIGVVPRRQPHHTGPFRDGPFSRSLAGLGPAADELAALDHLATVDLSQFLEYRRAASAAGSPFDWTASGKTPWQSCSGPVPDAGEDACLRHDFIYRNWRRLREDYDLDADVGDKLKRYADDRLGDDVFALVKARWSTWIGWHNIFTSGVPILSLVWAESVEPAVHHFGDGAWDAPYDDSDREISYYGEVKPRPGPIDPDAFDALTRWLCPEELCRLF